MFVEMFQLPKVMDIVGSLPPEISHEILKYLDPFDLGACCSVCKIWRYYANDDFLWRKLCLQRRVCMPIELPPQVGDLEPLSPWAQAFGSYSLRKINNWRQDRKSVHIIATLDTTVVTVFETMLAYTDELGVVFVYDLSDRTRFVQTIDLVIDDPVTALGLSKYHLVVRQGDVFTIFRKHKAFALEGFLVPHEGSYVFTRHYYLSEIAFVRHAMIDDSICILYDNSLFIYSLYYSSMHTFKVDSPTFLLHDHHRVYVGTGKHTITGFNSNGAYIDLDLSPSSVVSIKSNEDIIVALVCEEYNSGRYYIFKVWSRKFPFSQFHTSRPFGLEVAGHGSRFASVANDKFGQRVFVSLYDLESKSKYDVDLNASEPIAQAKIQFLGRDLLYVVTRRDWGPYDMGYLIDLKTMETLYEIDLDHTGVVSVDSSLAVYMNSDAIEIHFYNR